MRQFIEDERARRAARPVNEREREDAPPAVLHALWRHLVAVAGYLGVDGGSPSPSASSPYDPLVYQRVYERVLGHRRTEVVAMDEVLPTTTMSVYDFAVARRDVVPSPEDAARFIRAVEAQCPDLAVLEREIDRWSAV